MGEKEQDQAKDAAGNTTGNVGITEASSDYAREAQEAEDKEREALLKERQNGVITQPFETAEERKAWRDKEREDAAKEARQADRSQAKAERTEDRADAKTSRDLAKEQREDERDAKVTPPVVNPLKSK